MFTSANIPNMQSSHALPSGYQTHHQMYVNNRPSSTVYPQNVGSNSQLMQQLGQGPAHQTISGFQNSGRDAKAVNWEMYEAKNKARSGHLNKKIHKMIYEERAHMKYIVSHMGNVHQQQQQCQQAFLHQSHHSIPRSLLGSNLQTTREPTSPTAASMVPQTPYNGAMVPNVHQQSFSYDSYPNSHIPSSFVGSNFGTPSHQQNLSPASTCTPVNQSFSSVSNVSNGGSPCSMNASYSSTPPAHLSPSANSTRSEASSSLSGLSSAQNRNITNSAIGAQEQSAVNYSPISNVSTNQPLQENSNNFFPSVPQSNNLVFSNDHGAIGNLPQSSGNQNQVLASVNDLFDYISPGPDHNSQSPYSQSTSSSGHGSRHIDWTVSDVNAIPIGQSPLANQNSPLVDMEMPPDLDLSGSFEEDLFRPDESANEVLNSTNATNTDQISGGFF
ncbi:uncharacterized protein LOC142353182 [Convolutriloba macropyga]|uniref:uncharacterized protein LOC142353182 n=1 Tax=Convolutriloba macropyga TaxID=536237 RepID=UPI003F522922